jgi:hypothetical protein
METILHLLSSNYLLNKNLGQYQSDLAYFFVGLSVLPVVIAVILRMTTKNSDIFAKRQWLSLVHLHGLWV